MEQLQLQQLQDTATAAALSWNSEKDLNTSRQPPQPSLFLRFRTAVLYVALAVAVVLCGSSGVVLKFLYDQHGVSPLVGMAWRFELMLLTILGPGLYKVFPSRAPPGYYSLRNLLRLALVALLFFAWVATWALAIRLTSVTLAFIFTSCHVLFLVLYNKVARKPVSKGEIIGSLVGFSGLLVVCIEPLSQGTEALAGTAMVGNVLALAGSVCGAFYFVTMSDTRRKLGFFPFAFPMFLSCYVLFSLLYMVLEGGSVMELFTWVTSRYLLVVLYLGLGTGAGGIGIYQVIAAHLPTVVIAVSNLMQTVAAALLSWALGVEEAPTVPVVVGSLIIMAGCGLAMVSADRAQRQRTPHEEAGCNVRSDIQAETETEMMKLVDADPGPVDE